MTTPQKPSTKQQRREAIQAANPLDGLNNMSEDTGAAPDEFRMPEVPAPDAQVLTITKGEFEATVANAVAVAVAAAMAAPRYSEDDMIAMRQRAREEAAYTRFTESTAPLTPGQEQSVAHISSSGRAPHIEAAERVWIVLDDNDEIPPGGQFIGINGVGYMLMAGVEAFVPKAVCNVLDEAVKSVPVLDQNTKRVIGWKNRKRFPYTVVRDKAAPTDFED
jgi:hypothetical protein